MATFHRALVGWRLLALLALLVFSLVGPGNSSSGASDGSTHACKGVDLVGAFAGSNLYAGGAIITLAITDVGISTCRLGGYPKLLGIRGNHEYTLANVGHGTQDTALAPTTLVPRESGALILDSNDGCSANVYPLPAADKYTGVVILLPNGEGRVKVLGVPLWVPCGLSESQLGWAKRFAFD